MTPDKYQQAWQAFSSQTRVTVNADLLRQEVERSQGNFRSMIFWRDVREIAVGLVLILFDIYIGINSNQPWTWWLSIPALLWVIGFMLIDRRRHKQKPIEPGAPLVESATESLTQLEHQIWLLRNVFWWYLLPLTIAIVAYFALWSWQVWEPTDSWLEALGQGAVHAFIYVVLFATYWFVYWMNQRAVRTQLEPKRQELLALIANLKGETTDEISGEYPILLGEKNTGCSRRRIIFANICLVVVIAAIFAGIIFSTKFLSGPALSERSPFAAVRWQESQPEVKVGGEWFKLVSLDGVPASDIVAYSRRTEGIIWRKRFEEDLVMLLTGMGHPPKDTVRLVVIPVGSQETRTLEDVPMTNANRRAIWDAAQARERSEQKQPTRSSPHADDAEAPFTKLIVGLREEKDLVGLAAMVAVDGDVTASAVDGERKKGSGVWLGKDDQWHLSGVTKPITATMIARLVESGQMKWTDSIADYFPERSIHEQWKTVTLKQLLTDTAGAPAQFPTDIWFKRPAPERERMEARREAVLEVMSHAPEHAPGQKYVYSNVGYTIAAAMAEEATGMTWEDLMTSEVFEPLGLKGAGFGPPISADDTLEQPRGHSVWQGSKLAADDEFDNTPVMGPAATIHMTLADACHFATEHLRGERGKSDLLSADTYKLLHTPELNDYAFGWVKKKPTKEIPYTVYWHNGWNRLWYALLVFIPEKNMVVAVDTNDGDREKAEAAAWEIVKASVK